MVCIYCRGEIVKYGLYSQDKQRYKCLQCRKTFSDRTIETFIAQRQMRLVLHLILAGCDKSEVAAELEIEEKIIDKWTKSYLKSIKEVLPGKPLLATRTLITIYKAIEKSRIAKLNCRKLFRRRPR